MKIIDKVALILFSTIILILSLMMCLLIFGWIELGTLNFLMRQILANSTYSNILLGISILFILTAIKCIFFSSSNKLNTNLGDGILLENENGKLLISKDTVENLVNSVAKGFESTQNVTTRIMLDKENNIVVYVNLMVQADTIIKELSNNLQTRIKEVIKKTSDLEVKEVIVKIKNISNKTEKVQE